MKKLAIFDLDGTLLYSLEDLADATNYDHVYLQLSDDKSTITIANVLCTLATVNGQFNGYYDAYRGGMTFTKVDRTIMQKAPTKKNVEAIAQKAPTKKFVQILPQKIPMIKDVQTIVQQGLKKKLNQTTPQKVSSKKSLIQDTPFDITNISKI
jgi:phosphoglycolate phosphatase-like HAD superfamily hydrolase